ncbi:hypothetical protein DFH28DRAFT_995020 [Melampsora americana]|nr:hypothetical protein DFH28DRAFT_995020 [Melampsora americana]
MGIFKMIFFARTYIIITFGLLTLVHNGNSKFCSRRFQAAPKDLLPGMGGGAGRYLCGDENNTFSFPQVDCKPSNQPLLPPHGSGCEFNSNTVKNGNCPTYYPARGGALFCDFQVGENKYIDIKCKNITNLINCADKNGVFVPRWSEKNPA